MTCPYCGEVHPDDTKICPTTGQKIQVCRNPTCNYREPIPAYAIYCPACGHALESMESLPAVDAQETHADDDPTEQPQIAEAEVPMPADREALPDGFRADAAAKNLDMGRYDTSDTTDMSYMFRGCTLLRGLDLSGSNTSKVTNMSWMFVDCSSLTALDLSRFDTREVTNMFGMFYCCKSLESLDLSGFDTTKVEKMGWMFNGCKSLRQVSLHGCNECTVDMLCQALASAGLADIEILH